MKKLLLLFVATAAFIGCSSDDNNSETPVVVKQDLVLSTSKANVTVGEELEFTIVDKAGKKVDAGVYVDNKAVANPVKFDQAGIFSVVAKKEGFKDSNILKIDVSDKKLVQLKLEATASSVIKGDQVMFTVFADNVAVKDAIVYNEKTGEALVDNVFEANELGMVSFVAKKEGFADSAVLTVNVESKPNGYFVNGLELDIDLVVLDLIQENVVDVNGKSIVVDKVVELEDGRLANEYSLMLIEENNFTFLTLWVANNSIVKKNGVIVDYGKRILPTEVTKKSDVVFRDLFIVGEYFIMENYLTVSQFVLDFNKLEIPAKGIGVGEKGVMGDIGIGFDFESDMNNIEFNYTGEIFFTETIEKESRSFRVKNKL